MHAVSFCDKKVIQSIVNGFTINFASYPFLQFYIERICHLCEDCIQITKFVYAHKSECALSEGQYRRSLAMLKQSRSMTLLR